MSGGIGVLRDREGSDRYTAGVFAQGTGYWGGMGLLLDGAGDDRYDARWYVQGAADRRWPIELVDELKTVPAAAFEAVDTSGLMVDPDSMAVR